MKIETPGIYAILNIVTGKRYIGSSIRMERRMEGHKRLLIQNKHANRHLQFAWNKYGPDSFVFEILEVVDLRERFKTLEQSYVDRQSRGVYNIAPIEANTKVGTYCSIETRQKMSISARKARLGKKATLAQLAALQRARNSKSDFHTPEAKLKISLSKLGKKRSPEARAAISAGRKGKPLSKAQLDVLANARASRKPWAGTRPATEKQLASIALARAARTEASNKKQSESLKLAWKRRKEQAALNAIYLPTLH